MKLSKKLLKSIIAAVAIIVVVIVAFIFFGPRLKEQSSQLQHYGK